MPYCSKETIDALYFSLEFLGSSVIYGGVVHRMTKHHQGEISQRKRIAAENPQNLNLKCNP